jgi:hypothetical protein
MLNISFGIVMNIAEQYPKQRLYCLPLDYSEILTKEECRLCFELGLGGYGV